MKLKDSKRGTKFFEDECLSKARPI